MGVFDFGMMPSVGDASFRCTTTTPPIALRQRGAEGSSPRIYASAKPAGPPKQCSLRARTPVLSAGRVRFLLSPPKRLDREGVPAEHSSESAHMSASSRSGLLAADRARARHVEPLLLREPASARDGKIPALLGLRSVPGHPDADLVRALRPEALERPTATTTGPHDGTAVVVESRGRRGGRSPQSCSFPVAISQFPAPRLKFPAPPQKIPCSAA